MCRWATIVLIALALVTGHRPVAAEDDPFGPPPPYPPEVAEPAEPAVPMLTLLPAAPVEPSVLPLRQPRVPKEKTPAELRVMERAAQAARERKALIQQRKQNPPAAVPLTFPSTGPLAHPSLFRIDRGIAIAFRPIALAGIDPLPNLRPVRLPPQKTVPRAVSPAEPLPKAKPDAE